MAKKPASALRESVLCEMGSALIVSAYENHKAHARFQESQRSWVMAGFIAFSSGLLTVVASQNYVAMGDQTRVLMLVVHMAFAAFTGIALVKFSRERGRHFRQAERIVAAAGRALTADQRPMAELLKVAELNTLVYSNKGFRRSLLSLFSVSAVYNYFVSLFLTIDIALLSEYLGLSLWANIPLSIGIFVTLNITQHRFSRWLVQQEE